MAANSAIASGSGAVKSATREYTAKATVADHISQAVQSLSSHATILCFPDFYISRFLKQMKMLQNLLNKLPKNLIAKASTIKNTGQVLEQMPQVISSLDAHMDNGLESVPHLETVIQLLKNMESCQLNSLAHASFVPHEGSPPLDGPREVD